MCDNHYAHAHLAARKISLAIEGLNASIQEAKRLGVQMTLFAGDDPAIAVPRIIADIAVLQAEGQAVVDRLEVVLNADPDADPEKEEETCQKQSK